jgi:hypothetical protein
VLTRELYRGVIVWNRWKKRNEEGEVERVRAKGRRPESEWIRTPAPELQIVSDELWESVQRRLREVSSNALRFSNGRLCGGPTKRGVSNLLAGLASCAVCGGGLVVESSGGRRRDAFDALPAPGEGPSTAVGYYRYYACGRLQRRISRLHEVILESGGSARTLLDKLTEHEKEQQRLQERLGALRPVPRLAPAVVADRLAEWRRLMRGSVQQARLVLQKVLDGRIVFTPRADGRGYDFACPTRFDRLFQGVAVERPGWLQDGARGREHITRQDTRDADYAELLERANAEELVRPWRDSNPRSSP